MSKLNISCRKAGRGQTTRTITIWLEHHKNHTPYYDVSLPPEAAAMIRDDLEWITPSTIAAKIQAAYPTVSANQVHFAWTKMSEILWKRDAEQLPSVQALLAEFQEDADILGLPEAEGVEQVAWAMKRIIEPLKGKIVEIGVDSTCETEFWFQKEFY